MTGTIQSSTGQRKQKLRKGAHVYLLRAEIQNSFPILGSLVFVLQVLNQQPLDSGLQPETENYVTVFPGSEALILSLNHTISIPGSMA